MSLAGCFTLSEQVNELPEFVNPEGTVIVKSTSLLVSDCTTGKVVGVKSVIVK